MVYWLSGAGSRWAMEPNTYSATARAFEQGGVAAGARAHHHGVGIADGFRGELFRSETHHLSHLRQAVDIRNVSFH